MRSIARESLRRRVWLPVLSLANTRQAGVGLRREGEVSGRWNAVLKERPIHSTGSDRCGSFHAQRETLLTQLTCFSEVVHRLSTSESTRLVPDLGDETMPSHRELKRYYDDPQLAASLARQLIADVSGTLSDWEIDFLDSLSNPASRERLSTRQAEVLLDLRERTNLHVKIAGISVRNLVQRCWEARFDLSEEDEEFVCQLRETGSDAVRTNVARRLIRCSRQLRLIEGYVDLQQ